METARRVAAASSSASGMPSSRAQICDTAAALPDAAERIVCESTGPYQKLLIGALLAEGLPAVVANPRQVRDFAKGMGQLAKTDIVDAAIIAHFAEVVPTTVRPLPSAELSELRELYVDAKKCIRAELTPQFLQSLPKAILVRSTSNDRDDYILHPQTGEKLDERSYKAIQSLRTKHAGTVQIQIVVSDGLNAFAIMDVGHLAPYLAALREDLKRKNYTVAPELLTVHGGRVRAGELDAVGLPGCGQGAGCDVSGLE